MYFLYRVLFNLLDSWVFIIIGKIKLQEGEEYEETCFFDADEDPEGGYRISTQIPLNELRFVNSYNKAAEPSKSTSTNIPVTGDHTNPVLWILLVLAAGGGMALWLKKKYRVFEK